MPLRYFLPLYLLAYFLAAFFWRSYKVWKKTGVNPIVFRGSDNAHDFIGQVFKLVFASVVAVVVVHSFLPAAYRYTLPIELLEHTWVRSAGVILLILSLVWTVLAQAQMGESWRIGIDNEHKTPLVQNGVFSISRNPIFLSMIVTLAGLFLVIPNAVTLLTLLMGVVLINIQVRLEEEYLTKVHVDTYARYRQRVRRWL